MGIFAKTWKWRYEIAPMYMEVMAKPFTAQMQSFNVLCGLSSNQIISGERLPQIGEFVYLPGISGQFRVSGIRSVGFSDKQRFSNKYPAVVYIDSKEFGDNEYWKIGIDRMNPVQDWSWSTNFSSENYSQFGYTPSDWQDPEVKFSEREYVLNWKKNGSRMMTSDGKEFFDLDAKHQYLFDWFPEVKEHLTKIRYNLSVGN
jgi:hypothetical protein